MKKYILLYLLVLLFSLLTSFSEKTEMMKDCRKLLFYVAYNNKIESNFCNVSDINDSLCFKLFIDTIYDFNIKYLKGKDEFYYYHNIYFKSQLFELEELEYLKTIYITNVSVISSGVEFLEDFNGNCLNTNNKRVLKALVEHGGQFLIRFEVKAYDQKGKNIILNDVLFRLGNNCNDK